QLMCRSQRRPHERGARQMFSNFYGAKPFAEPSMSEQSWSATSQGPAGQGCLKGIEDRRQRLQGYVVAGGGIGQAFGAEKDEIVGIRHHRCPFCIASRQLS